jgi:hypothetical protein
MNPVTTFSDPYLFFRKNPNQNHHNEDGDEIFLTNIWILIISAFWQNISTRKCKLVMLQQQQQTLATTLFQFVQCRTLCTKP